MRIKRRTLSNRSVVAVSLVLTCAAAVSVPAHAKGPIVEGGKLEFRLSDLSGTPVSSEDPRFAGNVLLVDLWGTWCPPCITEIPTLVELQARYADQGLVIVGIAFEPEEQEQERLSRLRQFVEEQGINYLVLDGGPPDNFEAVFPAVKNVKGFPVEILIDRNGTVATSRNGYGYKKKWAAKLKREIEGLLSAPKE